MNSNIIDLIILTSIGLVIAILGIIGEHMADNFRKKINKKEKYD